MNIYIIHIFGEWVASTSYDSYDSYDPTRTVPSHQGHMATPSPRRVPTHHAEESRHWPRTHRNGCHLGRAEKSPKMSEKNIGRYGKIPYLWRVFVGKIMGNTATLQEGANFNGFLLVYIWAKCWFYGGYIEVVDGLNIKINKHHCHRGAFLWKTS